MKNATCKHLGIALTAAAVITAGLMPTTAHAGLTGGTWGDYNTQAGQTVSLSYDSSPTDPTVLNFAIAASLGNGDGSNYSLTQTSGSLTVNSADWGGFVGRANGIGTDTISGGSQTWNLNGSNDNAFYIGNGTGPGGTVNVNGGTMSVNSTKFYVGGNGTGNLNINGGTLISNASTLTIAHQYGNGRITFGSGAGVLDMTNLTSLIFWDGYSGTSTTSLADGSDNCYINFLTGSQGQLQINGWTKSQFENLVALHDIRIDGAAATRSQFAYANVGGTGVYGLRTSQTPRSSQTWTGATDGNWDSDVTHNWSDNGFGGFTWQDFNDAIFGATGAGPVTIASSGVVANSLTFNVAGYTLAGGDLVLSGPGIVANADALISSNVTGIAGLAKSGTGMLTLSGANTYTGVTTLSGGTLALDNANALGGGGNITFGGGTLKFGTAAVDYSSRIKNSTAAITVDTSLLTQGWVLFGSALDSSNAGGLTKNGTGILYLTGPNAYTGPTTLNAGQIRLGNTTGFGTNSALTLANVAGVVLDIDEMAGVSFGSLAGGGSSGGNILMHSTPILIGADNTSTTYGGVISGWSSITKTGSGTLTFTGTNTYSGTTTIDSGTLQLGDGTSGHDGSIAYSLSIVNHSNLVFDLAGSTSYSGTISGAGTTTVKAGTLNLTGSVASAGTLAIDSGAVLHLPNAGTDNVAALVIRGVSMPAGPYDASNTGGAITGLGVIEVGSPIILTPAYIAWTTSYSGFTDTYPTHDPDGDGMTNQQEYAFALDPTSGASNNPIVVPLNKTAGTFSYTRIDPAVTGLAYKVYTSTNLSTWTEDTGATQAITGTYYDTQTMEVTLSGLPLTAPKLFVRVAAE
jgi:autotransporter-associated beta strand protein